MEKEKTSSSEIFPIVYSLHVGPYYPLHLHHPPLL